jgi:uncharacterized membrane protein YkoI
MNMKTLIGSALAVALLGIGVLAGSLAGPALTSAQTSVATQQPAQSTQPSQSTQPVQSTQPAQSTQPSELTEPSQSTQPAQATQAKITQAQAEQAALAASPGNTVDHTRLGNENGTLAWDVDFANGGGVIIDAQTGAVIKKEDAGTDQGGHGGKGGADQSALIAQAKVTKEQAEQTANTASPGNTIDHTRIGNKNGTLAWDVDFANGGGVIVDATTGAVIAKEDAGTDNHGGRGGNH